MRGLDEMERAALLRALPSGYSPGGLRLSVTPPSVHADLLSRGLVAEHEEMIDGRRCLRVVRRTPLGTLALRVNLDAGAMKGVG